MWIDMHVSIVPTYAHMIWISSYILLVWKIYQWQVDNHIRISISGWDTYKWHQVIQPAATSSPSEIIFRPSAYRCSPICTLRSLSLRLRSLPRHSLGCKWGVWGEGPEGAGSPQSCCETRFMVKGPLKGPGSTWRMRLREQPQSEWWNYH
jgi:hypothetical protein